MEQNVVEIKFFEEVGMEQNVVEIKFFEESEKALLMRVLESLKSSIQWNDPDFKYEIGPDFQRNFGYEGGDFGTIQSVIEKLRHPVFVLDADLKPMGLNCKVTRYEKDCLISRLGR
jgi:hypothetical protein